MTDLRELLRPRVERGAALLDSVEPKWWARIADGLSLASCEQCVLGQLYGDYTDGVSELAVEDSDWRYGFDVGPEGHESQQYAVLDDLWLEAIVERSAA